MSKILTTYDNSTQVYAEFAIYVCTLSNVLCAAILLNVFEYSAITATSPYLFLNLDSF